MTPKPRAPKQEPPPAPRWRIVVGDREESYASEVFARKRWESLRRSVAGQGAQLITPEGRVVES